MTALKQMICPHCRRKSSHLERLEHHPLGIVGLLLMIVGLYGFCAMFPEVRRYLRLKRM